MQTEDVSPPAPDTATENTPEGARTPASPPPEFAQPQRPLPPTRAKGAPGRRQAALAAPKSVEPQPRPPTLTEQQRLNNMQEEIRAENAAAAERMQKEIALANAAAHVAQTGSTRLQAELDAARLDLAKARAEAREARERENALRDEAFSKDAAVGTARREAEEALRRERETEDALRRERESADLQRAAADAAFRSERDALVGARATSQKRLDEQIALVTALGRDLAASAAASGNQMPEAAQENIALKLQLARQASERAALEARLERSEEQERVARASITSAQADVTAAGRGHDELRRRYELAEADLRLAREQAFRAERAMQDASAAARDVASQRVRVAELETQLSESVAERMAMRERLEEARERTMQLEGIEAVRDIEAVRAAAHVQIEGATRESERARREAEAQVKVMRRLYSGCASGGGGEGNPTISRLHAAEAGIRDALAEYEDEVRRRVDVLRVLAFSREPALPVKHWMILSFELVEILGGERDLDHNAGSPDQEGYVYYRFDSPEDIAYASARLDECGIATSPAPDALGDRLLLGVRLYEPIASRASVKRPHDDAEEFVPLKARSPESVLTREGLRDLEALQYPRSVVVASLLEKLARVTGASQTPYQRGMLLAFSGPDGAADSEHARRVLEQIGIAYQPVGGMLHQLYVDEPVAV